MENLKCTFKNLFKLQDNTNLSIEIPVIQRDYAQGRDNKDVKRIRNNFLNTLKNAIITNTNINLDFIYGYIDDNRIIPIDGQQRLTTLFLLHWYVAKKENKAENEYAFLDRFTYTIRPNTRLFCKELVQCKHFKDNFDKKLSEIIENENWFVLSWKKDPTIKSMLNMLDDIHYVFKDIQDIWNKLDNITFDFLTIENITSYDDLYIKMNSRGKPLT